MYIYIHMIYMYIYINIYTYRARGADGCLLRALQARVPHPGKPRKVDVRLPGKLPWREAGPSCHHDDIVDSDQ